MLSAVSKTQAIGRVVHAWSYQHDAGMEASAMRLLHLTRELTAVVGAGGVELDVISSDSQYVRTTDARAAENAALPVLLRTVAAEQPQMRCRHIDLDGLDAELGAGAVWEELGAGRLEPEVAYRDGARFVARLRRFATPVPVKGVDEFVQGGVYLLTGGMGGIGVEMARLLLSRYGARLLLVGRREIEDETPAALTLKSLRSLGDIEYAAVDVCDAAAVQASVKAVEAKWGRTLDGILHMAAVYHDGVLARETEATLSEAFHAKVRGAESLETLLETRTEALFIGFSSVLSFFAGALVGVYSATNRALENLTLGLHARGFKAYSVAWSSWRETGMSRGQRAGEALRAKGIREMSVDQGWNSLLLGLRRGSPLVLVGLDATNAAIRKVTAGEPCALQRLSAFYLATDEGARERLRKVEVADRFGNAVKFHANPVNEIPLTASGAVDHEALIASVRRGGGPPYVAPETETERQICAVWQDVLNAPHLGVEDNFFMAGGHSLLATKVMSRLCSLFGADIPLRTLFDSPTVRGLAANVDRLQAGGGGAEASMTIRRIEDRAQMPLSFTQQRLWFLDQWQPGGHVYNVPLVFRVRGALEVERLRAALEAVVARHESLRTTFHVSGEQPVQRIHETAEVAAAGR